MGEVIRFVPKSELERARLIREARAIYESIFPSDMPSAARSMTAGNERARIAVTVHSRDSLARKTMIERYAEPVHCHRNTSQYPT